MDHDKIIQNAQFRKGLSISFFNATNNAIEIVKTLYPILPPTMSAKDTQELIVKWRDWLLAEHKTYYATVIAQVGLNFKPEETIAKLKTIKTYQELQSFWLGLSEDERQNDEIRKVVLELKQELKHA